MERGVDRAMAAQRPEKQAVRDLWVEEVRRLDSEQNEESGVPLYLTLPGRQAGDLHALIAAGLLEVTETTAIATPDATRVVAVEASAEAVIALNKEFPGLKILERRLEDLLKASSDMAWPSKSERRWFRAKVVNFDLTSSLHAQMRQGQLFFPALAMVAKVARLHAEEPCVDWSLCLTLNGGLSWEAHVDHSVCQLLAGNFQEEPEYSDQARLVLGEQIHDAILDDPRAADLAGRSSEEQQRVVMALVPKCIARDAHRFGWHVDTVENLRYGGSGDAAPMVTWILRFTWDERASTQPMVVYREALRLALRRQGYIDGKGRVQRLVN
jgi:hypothetical protein